MQKNIEWLLSFIPRALPVGRTEFYTWSDRIIRLCGELADADSIRFVLASNIMHLGPQRSYVSDQFFIRTMRKAAANQVSSQIFQEIKIAQQEKVSKEAADALAAKLKLAELDESTVLSNVQES